MEETIFNFCCGKFFRKELIAASSKSVITLIGDKSGLSFLSAVNAFSYIDALLNVSKFISIVRNDLFLER